MNKFRWLMACLLLPVAAHAQQQKIMHYSLGTGFFVSDEGYLLTNNHVIAGCSKYSVYSPQASMRAELVARDRENDLALLKTSFAAANIGAFNSLEHPLAPGDKLVIVGFPGKSWETRKPVVREATLLETIGPSGELHMLQFSDSVSKGNSGGPLLDAGGNVIGVITAKTTVMEVNMKTRRAVSVKHADVAINSQTVQNFLEENGVPYQLDNSIRKLSESEIADKARGFIVSVRCRVD